LEIENRLSLPEHDLEVRSYRGFQRCPFKGCRYERRPCPHASQEFVLTHRCTGRSIEGPGLIWHLIADHGFFNGPASRHRVDPKALGAVLSDK